MSISVSSISLVFAANLLFLLIGQVEPNGIENVYKIKRQRIEKSPEALSYLRSFLATKLSPEERCQKYAIVMNLQKSSYIDQFQIAEIAIASTEKSTQQMKKFSLDLDTLRDLYIEGIEESRARGRPEASMVELCECLNRQFKTKDAKARAFLNNPELQLAMEQYKSIMDQPVKFLLDNQVKHPNLTSQELLPSTYQIALALFIGDSSKVDSKFPLHEPKPEPVTEFEQELEQEPISALPDDDVIEDAESKFQPEAEPELQPEPQSEAEPEPQSEAETEPQSEAETELLSEPQPEPELQSEQQSGAEPELLSEPQPEPELQPEPQSEAETEPQSEAEPELHSEPQLKPELQPDQQSEAETEPRSEAEPELLSEPQPKPELQPDQQSEAETEPRSEAEPELLSEPQLKPELQPDQQSEAETEPRSEAEPELHSEPQPKPELRTEQQSEAEPELLSEPQPEPELQPEPQSEAEPELPSKAESIIEEPASPEADQHESVPEREYHNEDAPSQAIVLLKPVADIHDSLPPDLVKALEKAGLNPVVIDHLGRIPKALGLLHAKLPAGVSYHKRCKAYSKLISSESKDIYENRINQIVAEAVDENPASEPPIPDREAVHDFLWTLGKLGQRFLGADVWVALADCVPIWAEFNPEANAFMNSKGFDETMRQIVYDTQEKTKEAAATSGFFCENIQPPKPPSPTSFACSPFNLYKRRT